MINGLHQPSYPSGTGVANAIGFWRWLSLWTCDRIHETLGMVPERSAPRITGAVHDVATFLPGCFPSPHNEKTPSLRPPRPSSAPDPGGGT
jgi:hypothetical protein